MPSPNEPLASTATPAPSEENPAPEFTLESAPESTPVPESTPEPAPQLTFESTSEPASELTSETTPELTPTVNPTPTDTPAPSATPTPVPTPKPTPKSTPTPAPEPQKEINPAEVVFYTEAVKINLTEEDEAEIERLYQEMRNDPIYSDLKDWQIQALAGIQVTDRKAKEAPPFVSKYFTREERDKLVSYPYYGGEPKQTFEFVVKSNVQFSFWTMEKLIYLIKSDGIKFENNQKFYTEYNLTYCTNDNYYAIRGRLETENSDGSINKQYIEIIMKDGWMDKNYNLIPKLVDIVILE